MKKLFMLFIVGVMLFSCKATLNNKSPVNSVVSRDLLYHNKAAYTGNRSTYLTYFEQIVVQQPTDTSVMHLVEVGLDRKKELFRNGIIGVFKKQTEGINIGKWKLVYRYPSEPEIANKSTRAER